MTLSPKVPIRIVVAGHTMVEPMNRVRWLRMAELFPEIELTLLVPATWSEPRREAQYTVTAERIANYSVIPVPIRHFRSVVYFQSLTMHLPQLRPVIFDIIQGHLSILGMQLLLSRRLFAPNAITLMYTNQNQAYDFSKQQMEFYQESFVFNQIDAMTCENVEARNILQQQRNFTKPMLVQPAPGTDENHWRPSDQSALKARLGLRGFTVGFVGALMVEKGITDLVKAMHMFPDEEWDLLIVGDGPERRNIETLIKETGLSRQVLFTGNVNRADTVQYYNCMDVLVLPSRTLKNLAEQFGNVMIEGMLCEVPVIGSSCGSIPNILGNAGLVYEEGNVGELHQKIQEVRTSFKFRRDLAIKGHQRALENYSASALAKEKYSFYMNLLANRQEKPT